MRQRKPILPSPGSERLAQARRERKHADARAIEDARAYLGTTQPVARSPQSVFHFDRADQLEALVSARAHEPDCGFMARLLALCSLPRTNPGRRVQYIRRNGPYTLIMTATGTAKLPYGILPRLLLAWVCTEAVRTQSPTLRLGESLSAFMRKLGMGSDSGGSRGDLTRMRRQIDRLFTTSIMVEYDARGHAIRAGSLVAERTELWWNERRPDVPVLWDSTVRLGAGFFNELVRNPVPLDMNILKALKRSSLGVDLFLWLTYRTFALKGPMRLSWKALYRQFGADPAKANDPNTVKNFRKDCLRELVKIKTAWAGLSYKTGRGVLVLRPSGARIPPVESDRAG